MARRGGHVGRPFLVCRFLRPCVRRALRHRRRGLKQRPTKQPHSARTARDTLGGLSTPSPLSSRRASPTSLGGWTIRTAPRWMASLSRLISSETRSLSGPQPPCLWRVKDGVEASLGASLSLDGSIFRLPSQRCSGRIMNQKRALAALRGNRCPTSSNSQPRG